MKTDKERWRWVVGWKGYYIVSSHGRVKSVARTIQNRNGKILRLTPRFLRPGKTKSGHITVNLCQNGEVKSRYVHQLVAESFIGSCPEGKEIRHFPDRNPTNNRLDNLQYGTRKENFADKIVHGTATRGERSPSAKLTEEEVRQIRQLCAERKQTQAKIAKMFGVSPVTVHTIHHRKIWRHLV